MRSFFKSLFGGESRRPFIVLFPGRTGSSWLVDALSQHPAIGIEGEILVGATEAEERAHLQRLFGTRSRLARGFKTKLKDVVDQDGLAEAIGRYDVKVMRMHRADVLRLAISRIRASHLHRQSGRWNASGAAAPLAAGPIEASELQRSLEINEDEVRAIDRFIERLGRPVFDLEYAEILASPSAVLARAQRWLEVPERELAGSVVKNTGEDLTTVVTNLEELRRQMVDGPWASIFEVDLVTERWRDSEG